MPPLWSRAGDRAAAAQPAGQSVPERPAGPPSEAPVGSRRVAAGFFDRFPEFYDTSETSSFPWRLNLRHDAIFAEHADLFSGARVLDIASHDGRWSMAALDAGAAFVLGVEARPELVDRADATLRRYGVDEARFRFVAGDVFEVLAHEEPQVDVVLCLGFLYHTLRHNELFTRIRRTGATHLLLDTEIHRGAEPVVRLADEHVARQGNAVADAFSYGDTVLTGRPTLAALDLLARTQGFDVERLSDWDGLLRDNPEADQVRDYRIGRRATLRLRRA
ncbi:class I SAM-dependent methyltransferase [Nocardioides sp.]|uniref:class I SAM-dependent methyltransferase n=1 Tax=Nocardioides sp. TaxID=35761 RepID=UPI00262DDC1C|nr:class I SAM-dependent methyltransferase [Nocardioides sp.]MDI6909140.1 class I SAM-dependent methyltransferase [Nocardioides sp.]